MAPTKSLISRGTNVSGSLTGNRRSDSLCIRLRIFLGAPMNVDVMLKQ